MAGLYIHIPFCASRCIYCGFYSTTLLDLRARYVEALGKEMEMRGPGSEPIRTIYLGGGTPSQLTHDELQHLFTYINKVYGPCTTEQEITMECNPDDVHPGMFAGLPVNRVSMGAQTFSDKRLQLLHRRHSATEVKQAVDMLRKEGIKNISIDLMFGFPNETLDEWEKDIEAALALNVEHISAYSLMYEEGTVLYKMLQEEKIEEIDENLSNKMYKVLTERLTSAGYEHYEISNFARSGYRSRHNSSYWNGTHYIGIGAAAHSYDGTHREWNIDNVRQYIEAIEAGHRPFDGETIDEDTHYNDLIVTALRTREGINLNQLSNRHRTFLMDAANESLRRGLLAVDNHRLHLTADGILVSNSIMCDLMMV
ncbi:MAG: radical SAM family heme chaperone HemW [Prevotella sp.]|jgi:putative oxygen-independent coproporphyrinogen III oxidase